MKEPNGHTYRQLAGELRTAILAGRYLPGAKMPTERELSASFKVSRVTVRRALRLLEDERLLNRIQGSGTYVAPEPEMRIPVMIDYTGSMREHAPKLERRLLFRNHIAADIKLAAALHLKPGDPLVVVERVDCMEGKVVAGDVGYIPERFARGLTDRDFAQVAFVELWTKKGGFSIDSCEQQIEAVPAAGALAEKLGVEPGTPVLNSTEDYLESDRVVAGRFISSYNPKYICISTTYRWKQ